MVVDACFTHALAEQLSDVVAGTQDVANDQLERQRLGDIAYRLGNVDGGVIRLGEEQGHHDGRGMAGVGEPPGGRTQVRLCQVEVRRHRGICACSATAATSRSMPRLPSRCRCRGRARSAEGLG